MILVDFKSGEELARWQVINDDVMGGRSQADFVLTELGTAMFEGRVSLENNGGFSSVRCSTGRVELDGQKTLVLHIKGDGKRYQFRIKQNAGDYYSYLAYFNTSGQWETVELPLSNMYPSFRGRKLDMPNFSGDGLEEIAFLIGNKKAESFELLIRKIELQ